MVFTGESLLVRAVARTDFQQGDAHRLFHSIREKLFTLPDDCIVYPGHDYQGRTSSTIGEERVRNPRIGGAAREEDFVGYMRNLALPHPKQIAVALPANMRGGQPENRKASPTPGWGPVVMTYAGLPEIAPEWVANLAGGMVTWRDAGLPSGRRKRIDETALGSGVGRRAVAAPIAQYACCASASSR